MPDLDYDDVTEALEAFIQRRDEELLNENNVGGNPSLKKKSNFQTEEQAAER